ncbi:MAG: ATP-binding protein [Candidatus Aenigmarchaeota archaeon]|nr:ATP-binding protein [Candidatus Aenigmarchaeota archaeon]
MNVQEFVDKQVEEIKHVVGSEKALIAVSGGVDSTTCAVLTHKAMGNRLQCVFIDTGFMRLSEPERVKAFFDENKLPFKIIDARKRFMDSLKGLEDAEEKRKVFRQTFYEVLSESAKADGCKFLVQGTIAPDWIETKGGIKTQHNVLSQVGINPVEKYGFNVIEPLVNLYKDQVREVAAFLGIRTDVSQRQPFPGPGLLVRVIGEINQEKLDLEKRATKIVEENLVGSQYFAAIIDDEEEECKHNIIELTSDFFGIEPNQVKVKVLKNRVTGVKGDLRAYKRIALVTIRLDSKLFKPTIEKLVQLQVDIISNNPGFTRVAYNITKKSRKERYIILTRSVKTRDYMTAKVTEIPWDKLEKTAGNIMKECKKVSEVYYDVTPKPPATVEYE